MSFVNKVVIVTGASTGIGAVTALAFAKEGASVAIVGRNEANLKNVASQISAVGTDPLVVKAEITKDDDAKRVINDTVQRFGKLDILVNNAGILEYGDILSGKVLEIFDRTIPINLRAVVNLTMLAAPHLIKTKGSIVNLSSGASQIYKTPSMIAYGISKAGLEYLTKSSAFELAPSGVRVNCVSPGPVDTDMFTRATVHSGVAKDDVRQLSPLRRVSEPEEISDLILYLSSEKARGITGSIYLADNGFTMI